MPHPETLGAHPALYPSTADLRRGAGAGFRAAYAALLAECEAAVAAIEDRALADLPSPDAADPSDPCALDAAARLAAALRGALRLVDAAKAAPCPAPLAEAA